MEGYHRAHTPIYAPTHDRVPPRTLDATNDDEPEQCVTFVDRDGEILEAMCCDYGVCFCDMVCTTTRTTTEHQVTVGIYNTPPTPQPTPTQGWRSGAMRMYSEEDGRIPANFIQLGIENFKKEYRELRRSFRDNQYAEYAESMHLSDNPLTRYESGGMKGCMFMMVVCR